LDAASNNSVDDIRELANQVRYAPQQGRYKIYIIDEVHMLSASAFNAFLKTLEEPPSYAIFILATTEKHKILPTILSRCQIFDFRRITTDDTVGHLRRIAENEGMVAEDAALHVIAQKSEGCMRDALSMLDRIGSFAAGTLTYANTMEHLAMLDAEFYFTLTDYLLSSDVSSALLQLDDVVQRGFEGDAVLSGLSEHFRNLLLCKDSRMARLLDVPQAHRVRYHQKAAQAPPSYVISGLALLNEAELSYKSATNKRLHTELALIRLCYLLQATGAQPTSDGGNFSETNVVSDGSGPYQPSAQPKPAMSATQATATPQKGAIRSAAITQISPFPPMREAQSGAQVSTKASVPAAPPDAMAEAEPVASAQPVPETPRYSLPGREAVAIPPARRVSKNVLDDLEGASCVVPEVLKKELTAELAAEIFEKFRVKLRETGQSVLAAQALDMTAELAGPDEVRIVCPNEMSEEYAKTQRDALINLYCAETGHTVRVTTETRVDPNAVQATPQVLSKQEVYEVLSRQTPALATLKEGLNLQIDY
jgi:DNA polymerase-3 subunit gamma/tau